MQHKTFSLALAVILLATQTPLVFSQQRSASDWAAVQQLRIDEDLVVRKKDGQEVKGEMIEASETTLTLDRDGKPVSVPRAEVRQVYVIEKKAEKGKWALIGAGIGAGAGSGIGALKYSAHVDDSEIYVGMGLLVGTGIGAVSGMLIGQGRRKRIMVYDAR